MSCVTGLQNTCPDIAAFDIPAFDEISRAIPKTSNSSAQRGRLANTDPRLPHLRLESSTENQMK
jgi:hypothetical protein